MSLADTAPLVPLTEQGMTDFSLETCRDRLVAAALEYAEGDRRWAADLLGINLSTLYRMMRAGKVTGWTVRAYPNRGRLRVVDKEA